MMRAIGAAVLAVGLVLTSACKRTETDDTSAQKQVEQAQRESENAFDSAKEAQEKAREEQEDVKRAEQKVLDKQRELAEAQTKAQQERQEAEQAQAQAQAQSQVAVQEAQRAQARAAQMQQQARAEAEAKQQTSTPAPASTEAPTPTTETEEALAREHARKPADVEARQAPVQQRSTKDTWFDKQAQSQREATEVMQNDEGVVVSVTDKHIVLQRDNGSQIKLEAVQSLTMPTEGQRIAVQYRYDGMMPVAVRIEQR